MDDPLPAAVLLFVPISHPQRQKDDIQGMNITLYTIQLGHAVIVCCCSVKRGLLMVVISTKNSLSV